LGARSVGCAATDDVAAPPPAKCLGPFGANGGPTWLHTTQPRHPAGDSPRSGRTAGGCAGALGKCRAGMPDLQGGTTDQRGCTQRNHGTRHWGAGNFPPFGANGGPTWLHTTQPRHPALGCREFPPLWGERRTNVVAHNATTAPGESHLQAPGVGGVPRVGRQVRPTLLPVRWPVGWGATW